MLSKCERLLVSLFGVLLILFCFPENLGGVCFLETRGKDFKTYISTLEVILAHSLSYLYSLL